MDRILRHVDRNLADPCLGADAICAEFRLSRSYVYALFESHGGVARHIRRRRLDRAMAMLTEAGGSQRIGEIAYACGFNNETSFGRAFRAEFGMSPSEARGLALDVEKTGEALFAQLGKPLR